MGRVARYRSTASAHLRSRSGESLSCTSSTPRSMSLTARSATPPGAGLHHAPMPDVPTYAHSSAHSPHQAMLTAVWTCGHAPMHRHTLPSLRSNGRLCYAHAPLTPCRAVLPPTWAQSGSHARALAPHEAAWLARWPHYRAPLAVVREEISPDGALPHCIFRKIEKGASLPAP